MKAGTPDKQYGAYEYSSKGSPVEMRAPDVGGEYEVRYLTAQTYATLATAKMTVTAVDGHRSRGRRKRSPAVRSP